VAPQFEVVVVDVGEHGDDGVGVAGVAAQPELGQLRADVDEAPPGLARGADLAVVVRRAAVQPGQGELGGGIAGGCLRESGGARSPGRLGAGGSARPGSARVAGARAGSGWARRRWWG
jgi:hypothetical protein